MLAWINKANIFVFAWCIYNSQGIFFPKGTLFTQVLVVLLILISLYYMFVVNIRYRKNLPIFFRGLNLLIFMFTLYGTYLIIGGYDSSEYAKQVDSSSYLKGIYISLLPIYPFFAFFKEKLIDEKRILVWIVVFFVLATGEYFENQRMMLLAAMQRGSTAEEFTNNAGYTFLALIPACVFFYKKPLLQYFGLGYCMIFLLMGMKRGAVLIGIVCLIWLLWNNLKSSNVKKKLFLLLLTTVLCSIGYLFVHWRMEDSTYFQKRIEKSLEGNSSGRDQIYSSMIDYYWNETGPLQFVFGTGANATLKVGKNYAHNDWLEIAVNQGMIGLFIYMLFWFFWIRECSFKSSNIQINLAMNLLFVICLLKTFFSMSYGDMTISMTFIMGRCLAKEEKNEQILNSN